MLPKMAAGDRVCSSVEVCTIQKPAPKPPIKDPTITRPMLNVEAFHKLTSPTRPGRNIISPRPTWKSCQGFTAFFRSIRYKALSTVPKPTRPMSKPNKLSSPCNISRVQIAPKTSKAMRLIIITKVAINSKRKPADSLSVAHGLGPDDVTGGMSVWAVIVGKDDPG